MIIDTTEMARRLGLTRGRAIQLIKEGRVPSAVKIGKGDRGVWAVEVPDDGPPVILPPMKKIRNNPGHAH